MKATLKTAHHGLFRITIADFANPGDTMDRHRHADSGHLSILVYGRVVSRIPQGEIKLSQGSVVYWPIGTEHEWEALEPSLLINVFST